MIEKIGKQESLPENMGIIPILKMKKVIIFPKFSLTESDTVGPQLCSPGQKNSRNYHIKAPSLFFSLIKILLLIT